MHYNDILIRPFKKAGFDVVYQPSCLQLPYDQHCWPIKFPEVNWKSNTVVVIHCQDFVSVIDNKCPELNVIEEHFGDRSNHVIVVHWNIDLHKIYNGPLKLIYFPTHSYELLHNLLKIKDQWQDQLIKDRSINWQCLNGTERRHRELIAYHLRNTFDNGILSLNTIIPLSKWDFDTYRGCENETNWLRLLPIYGSCKVNIITETMYYENPGIITEKTLMALLGLQIPIVIGYSGIVKHCKQLGFDMFEDLVDHSYDVLPNSIRWRSAIESNRNLINGNFDRHAIMDRLLINQDYVLNKWPSKLVDNFNNNARDIVQYLRQ